MVEIVLRFPRAYRLAINAMMTTFSTSPMALIFGALTPAPETANF